MKTVFVVHNSDGSFLGKQNQWLSPAEAQAVWRSPHHDVALNQMIEANAREIMLRLQIMSCPLSDKDLPLLEQAVVPKKMAAIQFDDEGVDGTEQAQVAEDDDEPMVADLFDEPAADTPQVEGVDCPPAEDVLTAGAAAPASDAAEVPAPEFAQTAADDSAVIAGELATTDYANSTER